MHLRRTPAALMIATLALAAARAQNSAADWNPGATAKGAGYAYQVFSKDAEGEEFARYRVAGTIDASPERLVRAVRAVVADPERAPDGQTRRVLAVEEHGFVVYTLIDLPPLFSDREIVSRGASSADAATGIRRVDWKTIDYAGAPHADGALRIERAAGSWVFEPAGAATRATYETYIDLGGSLPQWLVQRMMAGTFAQNYEDVAAEALRPPS